MKLFRRLLFLAAVLTAVLTPVPQAAAEEEAAVVTTCTATLELLTLEYNPPLGVDQDPGTHGMQKGIDPTATCAGLFIGTVDIHNVNFAGSLSCTTSTGITGNTTFKWSDGTNSDMKITGGAIQGAPGSVSKVVVLSGNINSGKFNNSDVVITYTAAVSDTTACLNKTLESMSGLPTVTFTGSP